MVEIPAPFLAQLKDLLKEEFPAFVASLRREPLQGLRVNTLKTEPQALKERLPFSLEAVPWSPSGFIISENTTLSVSQHPYHLAGGYYLQEPSAMAVAEVLAPEPGERVLDLCAAPGGKTTHIVSLMKNQGVLVANEMHPRRAWELVKNLERWGARNTLILNEHPSRLATYFREYFDKVLVDAPCSGEGMFRKNEQARQEWSKALVQSCTWRQLAILKEAATMVRPGGKLVYSTCTFNPQENEGVIYAFLKEHGHFDLDVIPPMQGFSSGRVDWVHAATKDFPLERTLRLWPHLCPGEGHFIAVMIRQRPKSNSSLSSPRRGTPFPKLSTQARNIVQSFLENHFTPEAIAGIEIDRAYLDEKKQIFLLPAYLPEMRNLHVLRPGWWLGSLKPEADAPGAQFLPSHAFAMGIKAEDFRSLYRMSINDPDLCSYLRGESLHGNAPEGWVLAVIDEFPLGWLKGVRGVLKNHLPRGLRVP